MANIAPFLDRIFFAAHSPYAADPPALFMRHTIVPRTTRKISIPTFHSSASEGIKPSENIALKELRGLKLAYSKAPLTIPMKRELYTSLVTRARTMAITGGASDQIVPYTKLWCSSPAASSAKAGHANTANTTAIISSSLNSFFRFITNPP